MYSSNATTAYNNVQKLVQQVAWKFYKRFGGNVDDLLANANMHFMHAHSSYDPAKGAFTTHVATCVYRGLLSENRAYARKVRVQASTDLDLRSTSYSLLADLSNDANAIVRMAMDLQHMRPTSIYKHVKQQLQAAGWDIVRIAQAYSEVANAL